MNEWQGRTVVDKKGEAIGEIEEIFLDLRTGKWDWALVASGRFGRAHFVPLARAYLSGEVVRVMATNEQIKDAPSVDPGGRLSEHEEEQLFAHYSVSIVHEGSMAVKDPSNRSSTLTGERPPSAQRRGWSSPRRTPRLRKPNQRSA